MHKSLLLLPNELLIQVVEHLDSENDINVLSRTNRLFHSLFTSYLYRRNVRASAASALKWAMKRGRRDTALLSLKAGADINRRRFHDPPIVIATAYGDKGLVRFCLEHGADINGHDGQHSPLFAALHYRRLNTAKLLLDNGAGIKPHEKPTILHSLTDNCISLIPILLEMGACIDGAEGTDKTPLWQAIRSRNIAVAKELVCHGADPNLGRRSRFAQ